MLAALHTHSLLAVVLPSAGSSTGMVTVAVSVALRVTALLLLTAAAVRLMRDHSAGRRHFVIVLGALAALSIPVLALMGPRWNIPVLPAAAASPAALTALAPLRAEHALPSDIGMSAPPAAPMPPDPTSGLRATSPLGAQPPAPAAPRLRDHVPHALSPRNTAASTGAFAAFTNWSPSPVLQLFLAWLFGAAFLVGQLLLGVIRRSRLANTATDLLPAPWERSRARLLASGALPPRVRICATTRSSMPMTWGVVRPVILVPEHSDWTGDERDAALLHEVAHVRRGDALWLTVLSLVRAVHWYNPLAWWLCSAERLAREEACDDLVLDAGVRPSVYAEQLLGIVQQPSDWRAPAAALAMARPGSLARRLQSILRAEQRRDLPGAATRAISIAGAVLLAGCIGTATPVQRAATPPSPEAGLGYTTGVMAAGVGRAATAAPRDVSPTRPGRPVAVGSAASVPHALGAGGGFAHAGGTSEAGRVAVWNGFSDVVTTAAVAPAAQQACSASSGNKVSNSHSSNSDNRTESITWSRNGCKIELTARGEYTLSPNLDDLRSLARGGSFVLREDDGRVEREVRITPNADGSLEHRYRVDGETRAWDSEGKSWFAQVALRLDRATAWAVNVRFPALMSRGGVDAVLAEIDLLEGDYARRVYFTKLATSAELSSTQLVRVIDMAGSKIKSDYELAELLITASKQKAFDDPAQLSLARAASRIKSDYEKRRAFTGLLTKDGLSAATVGEILAGAQGMDSDYELAELLIQVSSRYAIPPATRRYYLDALGTIQSDYEYRRVVSALAKRPPLPADFTREILGHAATHVKGYELAELLITMDKFVGRDRTLALALLDAADHLESDYDHGRVLKDLVAQRPDTEVVVQLLKQAPRVGSAYERAEVLLAVARTYRIDGALHDSYVDAARSIDSDYERGRALAAAVGRRVER